jgi:hypothetical protein
LCQPDGSFKIIWKVDNSRENQALNVTYSSNVAVVPVGTQVPKKQSANFPQVVNGSQTGSFSLTLKANWPGDQTPRTKSATVALNEKCDQPVTPPSPAPSVGGQGGMVQGAQVNAPIGPVAAGEGSDKLNWYAVLAIAGASAIVGLGARQFKKS